MTRKSFMVVAAMAAVVMSAPVSQATRIDQGTLEIGVDALFSGNSEYGAYFDSGVSAGYFVRNGILLGGRLDAHVQRNYNMVGIFGTVEQHLELDTAWIPYIGTDLGFVFVSFSDRDQRHSPDGLLTIHNSRWDDDDTNRAGALVVVLRGGVKFFLTENLALDTNVNIALASARIYAQRNRDAGNVNVTVRTGFRYCF